MILPNRIDVIDGCLLISGDHPSKKNIEKIHYKPHPKPKTAARYKIIDTKTGQRMLPFIGNDKTYIAFKTAILWALAPVKKKVIAWFNDCNKPIRLGYYVSVSINNRWDYHNKIQAVLDVLQEIETTEGVKILDDDDRDTIQAIPLGYEKSKTPGIYFVQMNGEAYEAIETKFINKIKKAYDL